MRLRAACIRTRVSSRRLTLVVGLVLALAGPALAADRVSSPSTARLGTPPIGMHSMLYLNTPYSAMKVMFQQAADAGASEIRLNIELSSVFPGQAAHHRTGLTRLPGHPDPFARLHRQPSSDQNPLNHPHWGAIDEYMRLARTYHLRVLAVLTSTPAWMAACPRGTPSGAQFRCAPRDPHEWAHAAGEIAHHTGGVIDAFEIMNEPDGRWSFLGSPQQYANVLAASYDAIHAAAPTDQVALGGLMHLGTQGVRWMNAMLATPGAYAAYKFDVANIHVRVPPAQVAGAVCQWRTFFASRGFHGPLWVTETGYPADRAEQTDPGYEDGPRAQARWLTAVVPALLASGVDRVFITERDLSRGKFSSEGILQTPNPLPASPSVRRRPGFFAVQRLDSGGWFSAELHDSHHASSSSGQGDGARGC